jgi:molybdate transport system substrate-binding protein
MNRQGIYKVMVCTAALLLVAACRPAGTKPDVTSEKPAADKSILVHCAGGMRLPIIQMAELFEKETGCKVQFNFNSSNRLLAQIKLTNKGDVYIAGDDEYLNMAAKDGLVSSRGKICVFIPVIMVQKGNPKHIRSIADMLRADVKIGQGDPQTAIGRLMPIILEKNGIDTAQWQASIRNESPTVNDLALSIKLKTLDAAIVWDAIAVNYRDDADVIPIEAAKNQISIVESAVLSCAANKMDAGKFIGFIASEQGREICRQHGYTIEAL